MVDIEVVRSSRLTKGDSTRGIARERAFEARNVLFARSRIGAKAVSGWHHHGSRDLYGFLVKGRLRLEWSKAGRKSVPLLPGDFFHIPVGVVHRDVNPDRKRDALVVNLLLGEGPNVVNVAPP